MSEIMATVIAVGKSGPPLVTPDNQEVPLHVGLRWMRMFVEAQRKDALEPCKHGHFGCSAIEGGECMDEILSTHPQLEERFGG